MAKRSAAVAMVLLMSLGRAAALAQKPPDSPGTIWHSKAEQDLQRQLAARPEAKYDVDPAKLYTLAELIDLAQMHIPRRV